MKKEDYEKVIREKDEEIQKLKIKVNQLERRILTYENAHTPSSKQRFKAKKGKSDSAKVGAPIGHPKYERDKLTPTETQEYFENICPYCLSDKLKHMGYLEKYEEEIPLPQPIKVIRHKINLYLCDKCKRKIVSNNNSPKGSFGKNTEAHVAMLKFEDRLPLRKVKTSLKRHYGITITNVGIYGITKRVARKLRLPYHDVIKTIRSANVLYIDETEYKLNGKTWWLWVFLCEDAVLFVIRKSRGEKVIEEILGKEFLGKIVADGWIVYKKFAKILQRCWAHLLRECDLLEENNGNFSKLNNEIHGLFREIKKIRENPPPEKEREKLYKDMKDRLFVVGNKMLFNPKFKKLGIKILNGMDAWFTCVTYPEMEPTNNFAEQALRELIVQRKITGGLRSEKGAVVLERVSSCIATWKRQEKPLFETMRSYL